MYKSVKISEDAYQKAKILSKELEKSEKLPGVEKVNLSTAMGYALTTALADLQSKRLLHESAGVWKDVDTDKMIHEIYASRKKSSKKPVKL